MANSFRHRVCPWPKLLFEEGMEPVRDLWNKLQGDFLFWSYRYVIYLDVKAEMRHLE